MDTPKGAKAVLYQQACDCQDATAGTGRLKVHMNPEDIIPGTRKLRLDIVLMELTCNKCEKPWKSEVFIGCPADFDACPLVVDDRGY